MTRLDLAFVVSKYDRYTTNPTSTYFSTIKRICKYLAGTIGLRLRYRLNIYKASLNLKGKLVL